jgi:hypothetical protein
MCCVIDFQSLISYKAITIGIFKTFIDFVVLETRDSYNKSKLMVKKTDDNKLLDTLKKHSQFQKCGVLKL